MFQHFIFIYSALYLLSCSGENNKNSFQQNNGIKQTEIKLNSNKVDSLKKKVQTLKSFDSLIDIRELNQAIKVELKYTTEDNFMRMRLYEKIDRAYLQKDVAKRLAKVQDALSNKKPGYCLLVYDALRPVSVQRKMWKALDSIPPLRRGKFVSNPTNKSLHNMGAAVDLTIVDNKGVPLDMGAGFDDIREIAYPAFEQRFLQTGELSKKQVENRLLLRRLMQAQGFRQLQTEWWHYNACTKSEALKRYEVLYDEFNR